MTDEQLRRLESEMSRMRPQMVPADLIDRIERDLSMSTNPEAVRTGSDRSDPVLTARLESAKRSVWGDRLLLSAIASGAMAACVIVAVLVGQSHDTSPSLNRAEMVASVPNTPRLPDAPLAFARADSAWVELLK